MNEDRLRQKKNFIKTLSGLLLALQSKEKNPLIDLTDLANRAGVDRNQLGRWMSLNYANLPGPDYGIRLANYFIKEIGEEGREIYDSLEWTRPI